MKHIRSYSNVEALENALHAQTLETPYVCSVSESIDFNSKQPVFAQAGAEDIVPVRTFDGGGASSQPESRGIDGNTADKYRFPGKTLRFKSKVNI